MYETLKRNKSIYEEMNDDKLTDVSENIITGCRDWLTCLPRKMEVFTREITFRFSEKPDLFYRGCGREMR